MRLGKLNPALCLGLSIFSKNATNFGVQYWYSRHYKINVFFLFFIRMSFPIVFLTFHILYWSILISVSNFQEDPQDPLIPLYP
jgi:hypothetical protein